MWDVGGGATGLMGCQGRGQTQEMAWDTVALKLEGIWILLNEEGMVCDKTGEIVRDCLCCTMLTRVRNLDFIQNPMGVY